MAMAMAATIIVNTADTMPTDSQAERQLHGSVARYLIAIVALTAGAALLALAVPRGIAYAQITPWSDVVPAAIKNGSPLSRADAEAARADYAKALQWQPMDADLRQSLALLQIRLPDGYKLNAEGDKNSSKIATTLREAAKAAPNNAYIWSLIARQAKVDGMPVESYVDFIRLSALLGPYEASAVLGRTRLILASWNAMPADLQADANRNLRLMWVGYVLRPPLLAMYFDLDKTGRLALRKAALETDGERKSFWQMLADYRKEAGKS